jgi:protein-L-isoaspartate(D-aspartate) O-methyltransferase
MEALASSLARHNVLQSNLVRRAFVAVDRRFFGLPGDPNIYEDHPVAIGYGQTLSAPHMHVEALQSLETRLAGLDRTRPVAVLDVGSGSGILCGGFSLLLSEMGFAHGRVVGVEVVKGLAERSIANLRACGLGHLLDSGQIRIFEGSVYDFEFDSDFDYIHVGAAAASVPTELVERLAEDGQMLLPVGPRDGVQTMYLVEKRQGRVTMQAGLDVRYVPLVK